jgi:O-antigen ligase
VRHYQQLAEEGILGVVVLLIIAVVTLGIIVGSIINANRTGESIGRYLESRYGPDWLLRRDKRR